MQQLKSRDLLSLLPAANSRYRDKSAGQCQNHDGEAESVDADHAVTARRIRVEEEVGYQFAALPLTNVYDAHITGKAKDSHATRHGNRRRVARAKSATAYMGRTKWSRRDDKGACNRNGASESLRISRPKTPPDTTT